MNIITDPWFYLLAIPAVTMVGLSKGGFAGMGQTALPMLALVMPPLEAAAIMLPIMIIQDGSAVWVYRKDWNGRLIAITVPAAIVGVAAAGVLAAYISDAAVRVFIGVTTFALVTFSLLGAWRVPRERAKPGTAVGAVAGALSGFTSTLAQAGGPPVQLYLLAQKLPKMTFVGTNAMFFATVNVLKVAPYLALGQFSTKGLATSAVLIPLALATNQLGFWLVRRTPQDAFTRITLILMFLLSLELMRAGLTEIWAR